MPKAKNKTVHPASDEEDGQKDQGGSGGDTGPSRAWALAHTLRTCAAGEDISWHVSLHKAVSITLLFHVLSLKELRLDHSLFPFFF